MAAKNILIAVFSASRAEFGLLKYLCKRIQKEKNFELQFIAGGTHLNDNYGNTITEIKKAGINTITTLSIQEDHSKDLEMATTCSNYIREISGELDRLKPDIVFLLGDRYETFGAAISAHLKKIPIAHIHGGEQTSGALDDAMRHAITQLSTLHFTAAEEYKNRVIRMLGKEKGVFNIGPMVLDSLMNTDKIDKAQFEKKTGYVFGEKNLLITFHPETKLKDNGIQGFRNLLRVLEEIECNILFTHPNIDQGSKEILTELTAFCKSNSTRCWNIASLGHNFYINALRLFDAVIGNSSSGVIEAPLIGIPVLNMGDRQHGRIKSSNIIETTLELNDIKLNMARVLGTKNKKNRSHKESQATQSPSRIILDVIKKEFSEEESKKIVT